MLDYSRLYNSAGSIACGPQFIHPIIMSIVFEHTNNWRFYENRLKNSALFNILNLKSLS